MHPRSDRVSVRDRHAGDNQDDHGRRPDADTIDVDQDGIETDRPDALVSLGVVDPVETVERVTPEDIYCQVCGYIKTFEDEAAYETWTAEIEYATTTVMLETGIGLAGAIATELFEN